MTINFQVTGDKRKRLADIIATFMQTDKKYLGAPTFAYQVDYFTIDRNGTVSFDDRADSEEVEGLLEILAYEGFTAEPMGEICEDTKIAEKLLFEDEKPTQGDSVGLTVSIPLDKVNLGNLTNLLDAKGSLIQKALGISATPIEVTEDAISFPWFDELSDSDTVQAYTHFISALCEMSLNQKRITAKEKAVDNEKYAFRCFLLRLGFIGSEYKAERKILLRNLTGSSAFKNGAKKSTSDEEVETDELSE